MEAASRHVFNERAGPKEVETTLKVEGQCQANLVPFRTALGDRRQGRAAR
jgi:hypothetical protein